MIKVSRTIAYAVQAILQLGHEPAGVPIACGRIAADGRMPERFLLQVLRSLVQNKLLRSVRGVDGGYLLARELSEITLLDIFEAFDTPMIPSVPPLEGLSPQVQEKLVLCMGRVAASARHELAELTMADLLKQGSALVHDS